MLPNDVSRAFPKMPRLPVGVSRVSQCGVALYRCRECREETGRMSIDGDLRFWFPHKAKCKHYKAPKERDIVAWEKFCSGPRCQACHETSLDMVACDFTVRGRTCNMVLCHSCAITQGDDLHMCPVHAGKKTEARRR